MLIDSINLIDTASSDIISKRSVVVVKYTTVNDTEQSNVQFLTK